MTLDYVATVFCVAFSPLAIGLAIAEWDSYRKRQAARREFRLIAEREAAASALRRPYRFTGRAM